MEAMIKRLALLLPLVVTTAVLAVVAPASASTHSSATVRIRATTTAVLTSNVPVHPAKGLGDNWGDNWTTPV
jgi:hypothetical protein